MHKYVEFKQCGTEKSMGQRWNQREIQKNLKTNKNRNTTYKYMWDTAKGNFIAGNDYIIKKISSLK